MEIIQQVNIMSCYRMDVNKLLNMKRIKMVIDQKLDTKVTSNNQFIHQIT